MGIVREISPELDPVEFPDNMDEAAVDAFMAQRGRELRQGLIARRQAQLAAETEGDEALRYAEGGVPFSERVGSTLLAAPQSAMRQTGQTLRGLGEFLATAPIPRERGEIAPEIVRENIRRAQRPREQVEREVEASPTRRLGGEMVAAAPEAFPTLPGVRESLPSQVSGGIGSVGALLPAGLTGPAAPFVGGAMYGLSAGEDFADDAEQVINSRIAEALAQGNTEVAADLERRKFDMKNTARMAGRAIGAGTEGVLGLAGKIRVGKSQIGGIGARLAERMVPKTAPVAVQNAVRGAVEGGLTEAAQEGTEQILGNAAALAVYDPNRGIMDDVAQSVLVGGLTGKVVGGAFGSRGQTRDPLPASRAAVAGEVVPGTEIPQDIGAPDLTLEDLGDLLPVEAGPEAVAQPGTPVPATQETQENMGISQGTPVPEAGVEPAPETPALGVTEKRDANWRDAQGRDADGNYRISLPPRRRAPETPAVDSQTLSPATAAETPTAPETPASPALSSSAEGVTGGEQEIRNQDAKLFSQWQSTVEAAMDPMADSLHEANARTVPESIRDRFTAHGLRGFHEDTLASIIANGLTRGSEGPVISEPLGGRNTKSGAPLILISKPDKTIQSAGIGAVVVNRPWANQLIPALQAKHPGVLFISPGQLPAYLNQTMPAAAKLKRTRKAKRAAIDDMAGVEAAVEVDSEAERIADELGKMEDEESGVAFLMLPEAMAARVGKVVRERTNKAIREANAKREARAGTLEANPFRPEIAAPPARITPTPPDDTAMEAATAAAMAPRTPSQVTAAPDEGISERAAVDDEMTRATTRVPEVAPAQVGMPDEGVEATAAADAAMEQATRRVGETPAAAAMNRAPEEGIVGSTTPKIGDEAKKQEKRNRLSQLARAYTNRKEKSIADALKASGEQGTVEFIGKRKDKLIVSPEPTSTAGEWRVTQIDDQGPVTHHTFKTRTAAIRAAAGDSFSEFVSGPEYHAAGDYKVSRVRKSKQAAPIAPAAEPPAAQAAEVATPEAVKQSKPPMAPKAQKAYLLEKIDEAIAVATEEINPDRADSKATDTAQAIENADTLRRNKSRFGTVTIEVPGDGTFEVLNTKPALKAFKEKAKKFPTGKASSSSVSLPSQNQTKPVSVGSNTKESFLAAAEDFVFKDKEPGTRGAIQNIISNGFKSVALDGKMMLVWDDSLGGSLKEEAFFDTSGKPVKRKPEWRIPDWQNYVPKDSAVVLSKLDTERLFGVVQQAIGVQPRRTIDAKTKKPISHDPFVDIVKNPDGSIGVYAVGADQGEYTHNTQKGGKVISTVNAEMLLKVIQASRRMGSTTIDIEKVTEKDKLEPLVIKWDGATAILMPIRRDEVPAGLKPILAGKPQPDILERALNAAIEATDRKNATFSDPFLIAAVGLPVLNAALRIVRRVYLKTRDLARAKRQGMRLIRRQLRSNKQADLPKIEEAFNQLVEGTAEKPGPDKIEAFQAADGSRRQKSRGLFTGDVTVDTDAEWQAGAERWINQFNGNIRRAFEAARSTDYATTGLNPAAQDYVFGRLLELTEIQANAARNDVDAMRALNLQKEIADAMRLASSEAGKALGARALVQNRLLWMFPVLNYRNLIREAQKRLPFPDVVADEVRTWLQESGRRAVQEMRNAMTDADKVFARELKTTVRDMRVVWRDVMTASVESQEAMRRKILEELVKAPELKGLSRQGYIDIANLLGKAWEKERARIFAAEFRKQVPLPSVKEDVRRKLFTAIPDILKWANLGLLDNEAFRNAVAPKFGVAKFDGETAKKLNTMAQQAQRVGGVNRNRIIAEMYDTMQREGGVRWPDIVRDYWYAAVLGAVNTQVDNALGVINGALNTVMGMAMSPPEVRKAMGKAYREGFGEAIADFFPILWRGDVARAINFNPEQPANTLNALSKSGNLFARGLSVGKYVSRLMTALDQVNALSTDQAMKAYALGRRLPVEHVRRYMMPSENVLRTARLKAESEGTPPNLMRKRVREIVQESIPVEVLISSKDIRELVTFTNQPKGLMGALYRGVQEMEKKAPGFKVLSGTNFLRFAANYSNEILNYVAPVALYRYYVSAPSRADGRLGLKMGQEERQLILAKLAVGTALGTFAAALFLGDDDDEKDRKIDITGSFKSLDPNKRKQLLSEGRAPYSIRIGDKYVSYRQLPFGGVLGAIGELRDRQLYNPKEWNQESIARKFVDGAFAGSLIVRDSPAISSFTEFLGTANAYKYDMNEQVEKSLPKYIARLGGSFIPRIAKEIDAWADPTIYKANTGHEFFLQQMPIFRRELGEGPVLNVLGEPVQVERYPWSRWIKTRKEDKAWSTLGELASKGVFLPVPSVTVKVMENGKRREMTPAESYRYQQRVGQAYRKFVEDNSERLLRMKPDEATDFIDTQTERIRSRIRVGGA